MRFSLIGELVWIPIKLMVNQKTGWSRDAINPFAGLRTNRTSTSTPTLASTTVTPALDRLLDAVVTVLTNDGTGTGFFISTKGTILTNYHVIEGAKEIYVRLHTGTRLPAVTLRAEFVYRAELAIRSKRKDFTLTLILVPLVLVVIGLLLDRLF